MKRILKILPFALVILFLGLYSLLRSPWGLEKIRLYGEERLNALLEGEGEVEISGIEGNPFLHLTLKGIKIGRRDLKVNAEGVHFRYNPFRLLFLKELHFILEDGELRSSRFYLTSLRLDGRIIGWGEKRRMMLGEGKGVLERTGRGMGEKIPLRILEGEILLHQGDKDHSLRRFEGTTLSISSPNSLLKGRISNSRLEIYETTLSLEELRSLFYPSLEIKGDVEIDGEIWWEEGDPRIEGDLILKAEEFLGVSLRHRKVGVRLENGIFTFKMDLGKEGRFLFKLSLEESSPSYEFEGDFTGMDLSEIFRFYPTRLFGKVEGEGKGREGWKATFSFGDSQIHHLTLSRLEGTVEKRDGDLILPTLWVEKGNSHLRLKGETSREGVQYNLITQEIELSEILPFFFGRYPFLKGHEISGKLSCDLLTSGFPNHPSLFGSIWIRDPQIEGRKGGLLSADLQFPSLGRNLRGEGRFRVSQWRFSNRTIESLDLHLLSENGRSSYSLSSSTEEETLSLFGVAEQKGEVLLSQVDTFHLLGKDLVVSNREPIHFTVQKGRVALSTGPLDFLEGTLNLWTTIERKGESSLVLEGEKVSLMRLGQLLHLPFNMEGEGWFDLTCEGTLNDPKLQLVLVGRGFRLDRVSQTLPLSKVDLDSLFLLLTHGENRLRIEKGSLYREEMETEITGYLPLVYEGEVKIPEERMEFHLDLKNIGAWVFSPFRGLFELSEGKIDGRMEITGTPQKPLVNGELRISGGEIFIPSTSTPLNRVEGKIKLAGERILLEKVRGSSPTGWAEANGRVDLDLENLRGESFDIEITARNTPFEGFTDVTALVDGELRISGSPEKPRLEGVVWVQEGMILREFRSHEEDLRPTKFSYDFSIFAERNVWLRNSNADIELSGEVVVRGEEGRRVVSGDLRAEKGELFYLYRTYQVNRGILSFPNSTELNPSLDLEAETEIHYRFREEGEERDSVVETEILLLVTGTLNEPFFQLVSPDGKLSEEELLFYLTMDMPLRDLAESGVENLMSGAGNRGMVFLERRLSRELEQSIGLDALSLETHLFGGAKRARFTLGKYLSRDVYVSYSGDLLSTETNQFKVEYYLGRGVSFFGQRSGSVEEEEYDLGLQYKFRY